MGALVLNLVMVSTLLYIANMILSLILAIIIIDRLYISKKFSKEKDFHFYNEYFNKNVHLYITFIYIFKD